MTNAKGRALLMAAVCNAFSPPATKSTDATTPSEIAQKTLCQVGGFGLPPEVIMSITNEPESDDVTKKVITNSVANNETIVAQGSLSKKTYNAVGMSERTAVEIALPGSLSSMKRAEFPNMLSQKNVKPAGMKSTPRMNSRIVLPLEILAINIPTNGDQDIHHPQ